MDVPFKNEIKTAASQYSLDPALVAAIVYVESSFDPEAFRYEAKFKKKYIDHHPQYGKLDPQTQALLSTSCGLMQVMGVVAHEDGLPLGCLDYLFRVTDGLNYGCTHLKQLFDRYWQSSPERLITNAVAAYNAGTAKLGDTGRDKGRYKNQGYVDKVLTAFYKYRTV
jgi:soluble lytic murein transglycosylase-like protein